MPGVNLWEARRRSTDSPAAVTTRLASSSSTAKVGKLKAQRVEVDNAITPSPTTRKNGRDISTTSSTLEESEEWTKVRLELATAVEEHDVENIGRLLPTAQDIGVPARELEGAKRILDYEVRHALIAEIEDVRRAVERLNETVVMAQQHASEVARAVESKAKAEGRARASTAEVPAFPGKPARASRDELLNDLSQRLIVAVEPRILQMVQSTVADIVAGLKSSLILPTEPTTLEGVGPDVENASRRISDHGLPLEHRRLQDLSTEHPADVRGTRKVFDKEGEAELERPAMPEVLHKTGGEATSSPKEEEEEEVALSVHCDSEEAGSPSVRFSSEASEATAVDESNSVANSPRTWATPPSRRGSGPDGEDASCRLALKPCYGRDVSAERLPEDQVVRDLSDSASVLAPMSEKDTEDEVAPCIDNELEQHSPIQATAIAECRSVVTSTPTPPTSLGRGGVRSENKEVMRDFSDCGLASEPQPMGDPLAEPGPENPATRELSESALTKHGFDLALAKPRAAPAQPSTPFSPADTQVPATPIPEEEEEDASASVQHNSEVASVTSSSTTSFLLQLKGDSESNASPGQRSFSDSQRRLSLTSHGTSTTRASCFELARYDSNQTRVTQKVARKWAQVKKNEERVSSVGHVAVQLKRWNRQWGAAYLKMSMGHPEGLDLDGFKAAMRNVHPALNSAQTAALWRGCMHDAANALQGRMALQTFCSAAFAVAIGDDAAAELAEMEPNAFKDLGKDVHGTEACIEQT